jgi:hypothetical protein
VAEEGDALAEAEAALREHEPLDEVRAETVPFLREVVLGTLADALEAELDGAEQAVAAAYDQAAELRRLEGVLPDGLFGRAMRERHLGLLACWRRGILQATGGLRAAPARIWLGAAPEHKRDVVLRPSLGVRLADGRAVEIGGRTELCGEAADGSRVIVSMHASTSQDKLERDLLAPFFTHLALGALGDGERPTRAIIVRPEKDGEPCVEERLFVPLAAEAARAYLALLAGELLRDVHAYFLPCEGVFYWKDHTDKGEEIGVRQSILLLRDDNWTRFASEHGPIPDPRDYPVPDEAAAAAIVERRFAPFFAATAPVEPAPRRKRR